MTTDTQVFKQVSFTGRAGEWFGIWIVNLLLTIVTIGIYSAWAKVRHKKYFYGNTSIEGRAFDYHATGMQIFLGRLIVVAALIVFGILLAIVPPLVFVFYPALAFVFPWLLIRSARFNARVSSWSNVRFDFKATYGDALVTCLLVPIGVALTLYTTFPFLTRRANRFYIDSHRLGRNGFTMEAPIGPFYKAAGLAILWIIAVGVVAFLLGAASIFANPGALQNPNDPMAAVGPILAIYAVTFVGFLPAAILYHALVRNVVYAHTILEGGHRFASTTRPLPLLGISVTNALAIVFTLGLALPWAQVRMARYLADNTFVAPNGSLDQFAGQLLQEQGAFGDAFTDIEGIDIGGVAI